jgi:hypothetical protein
MMMRLGSARAPKSIGWNSAAWEWLEDRVMQASSSGTIDWFSFETQSGRKPAILQD